MEILHNFDLTVSKAQSLCLIGPNGAGKSTILHSIYGFTNIFESEHQWNFYSGMFDFSDDGAKSTLFGIQHQNENLLRDSFLGTLSPVTGFMLTADNATYFYTGIQAEYKLGFVNFVPSFTPGLYGEGDGKDLGHLIEFKSEVQLSLD